MGFILVLLIAFNFGVSWLNAWSVGKMWVESKAEGGFTHFATWCATIMSAAGFTWVYTTVLAFLAGSIPYKGHMLLAPKYVNGTLELGYLIVILPILGSGLGITVSSWRDFKRNRSLANGGVAGYNTFAQMYNTYEAVKVVPGIFKDLGELFDSKGDSDNKGLMFMIAIVIAAVVGGCLTTFAIVKSSAETQRLRVRYQIEDAKAAAHV
jgi:hypothetical protein